MKYIAFLLVSMNTFANLEVIKPDYSHKKIVLTIVRASPDSWETYRLINKNSVTMTLVCANNRIYDNNPLPFIEYRNFYSETAGNFTFPSNKACLELGKFIENIHMGIDESNPFVITLSRDKMEVERIVYPNIDPLDDTGNFENLFPKKKVIRVYPDEPSEIKNIKIK